MKFNYAAIFLAATVEAAVRYTIPYDGARFKNAPGPGLLNTAGLTLPNPFNWHMYDPAFSVIALNRGTLLQRVVPNTSPNTLIATGQVARVLGYWRRAAGVTGLDFESVAFTCVAIVAGQPVQVQCTVLFEGSLNELQIAKNAVVTAPANGRMTVADLSKIGNTRSLSFTVNNVAGLSVPLLSVSLLIDTSKYTTRP